MHDTFLVIGKSLGSFAFSRNILSALLRYDNPKLEQEVFGYKFKNPVGLSAGFDKDGDLLDVLPSVGFGFSQVGTITAKPYGGNKKPRLYRLIKSKSIVVYYGLKNIGVDKIMAKITGRKTNLMPTGISIGRTNSESANATLEASMEDYAECAQKVFESGQADIYTINISCPNLHCGEQFTTPGKLDQLLGRLYSIDSFPDKPLILKMPINLPYEEFRGLVEVAIKYGVSGLVIGNLNKDRENEHVIDRIPEHVQGSLSGTPTRELSNSLIENTYREFSDQIVIIGVGGIFSAEDAYEKIQKGATLVQLITGLIFEGPQVVGDINKGLVKLLERDGYTNISDAIGSKVS